MKHAIVTQEYKDQQRLKSVVSKRQQMEAKALLQTVEIPVSYLLSIEKIADGDTKWCIARGISVSTTLGGIKALCV